MTPALSRKSWVAATVAAARAAAYLAENKPWMVDEIARLTRKAYAFNKLAETAAQ